MGDLIKVTIKNPLKAGFKNLPKKVQAAIAGVLEDTSKLVFDRIKTDTPRDRGTAAGGWTRKVTKRQAVLSNSVPYINVLEYGGYPVIPKSKNRPNASGPGVTRKNAVLGGYPPANRTQVGGGSPTMLSNVSRQAPKGMVRQNLERIQPRFVFDLEEAIDKALEDVAE